MTKPLNPWPWAIILTFVLFISGTVGLVVMASSQRVDLVSKNYYEQELKYQGQIDRAENSRRLSAPARIAYNAARRQIVLTLPPEHATRGVAGKIELYRPSEANLDRQVKLQPDAHGSQALDVGDLRPGLWKVRISWATQNQEFYTDQQVVIATR
jgi:hypothetical protein